MTSRLAGTSSATRTLDQHDLAALRPATPSKPRKRSPHNPALREVTNGIVCFCGERFGESQALEFMLHLRAEVGQDLALLEKRRQWHRDHYNQHKDDPEYREHKNAQARDRYANDPKVRERQLERASERWATDPEYRKRKNARERERRAPAEKLAAIEALFTAGLDRLPAAVGLAIIRGDAMPAPYPGSA